MVLTESGFPHYFASQLQIAGNCCNAAMEVHEMRGQYFRDIVSDGMYKACQMENLV